MIHLLCGPVASGKTTFLKKWAAKRRDVGGILSIADAKIGRIFVDIQTGDSCPMEISDPGEDFLPIGKYRFSIGAFNWAEQRLGRAFESSCRWMIIDEIGPLELGGKGLDAVTQWIIKNSRPEKDLLLVVRERLIAKVLHHYSMNTNDVMISRPAKIRYDVTPTLRQDKKPSPA